MLWVHFGPWFGFLAAHHESIWILGAEASWKLKGVSWPCKSKRSNEGCGSHADEGDFGAEGEGIQEVQMLRGDEYKRWEDRRAKGRRGHFGEGKFCWWEEQKVSSIFWVESVGESFSTVVFLKRRVTASQFWKPSSAYTDHIWWSFWGKHAEFSLLTAYLPRLHMLFLLPHHLFFPLIWRLYCLGVDNKGHTWLLLFASLIT